MKPCFILFSIFVMYFFNCVNSDAENIILSRCANGIAEFSDCVKYKTIIFLDRMILNEKPIPLSTFLYLTHDESSNVTNVTDDEFKDVKTKSIKDKLDEVLIQRIKMVISTKNLQIKLTSEENESEGRKKKDKDKGYVSMMMGVGAMMMHGILTKLAFLAGKALIIAKIALILAIILALKKMMGQEDHHESTVIWKQGESTGSGWHRSMDTDQIYHAHKAAYSAHTHED